MEQPIDSDKYFEISEEDLFANIGYETALKRLIGVPKALQFRPVEPVNKNPQKVSD